MSIPTDFAYAQIDFVFGFGQVLLLFAAFYALGRQKIMDVAAKIREMTPVAVTGFFFVRLYLQQSFRHRRYPCEIDECIRPKLLISKTLAETENSE